MNGTYYYPVSGSDDQRCSYTCEATSTCGSVIIPEDHLKVSTAAINTLTPGHTLAIERGQECL